MTIHYLRYVAAAAMIALLLLDCGGFGYSGPKGKCVLRHYMAYRPEDIALEGCDPETFDVLSASYARDVDQVWFTWHPIAGADPASFDVISNRVGDWAYARDAHHVYLEQHRVCGADPATFRRLDSPYARDASKVFCANVPIAVSDPQRFRVLEASVKRNGPLPNQMDRLTPEMQACVGDERDAEAPIFQLTDQGWARDGKHYFRGCYPMQHIDYASFEILGNSYYSKDRRAVYYGLFEIPGADPSTFEMVRPDRCGYAKDAHAVYFVGRVFPGADPATFEVAGPWRFAHPRGCMPRDARRAYRSPWQPTAPKPDEVMP